jgi:hypothetical protein
MFIKCALYFCFARIKLTEQRTLVIINVRLIPDIKLNNMCIPSATYVWLTPAHSVKPEVLPHSEINISILGVKATPFGGNTSTVQGRGIICMTTVIFKIVSLL